ncbi:b570a543-35f4-4cac-8f80-1869a7d7e585 [Thermothielavioides terrestris]|uniref:B570a543-35f4-4cac-8f80-1869a7d7e585 n=1 Tax=Thermothielavioides terrestris TaxID=2587410 RepID=A0A446BPT1_9PEZI|nr:b570a543-35f4-4cac-8f80-1869a7d7e585 [Thermothielavioides terrestris]
MPKVHKRRRAEGEGEGDFDIPIRSFAAAQAPVENVGPNTAPTDQSLPAASAPSDIDMTAGDNTEETMAAQTEDEETEDKPLDMAVVAAALKKAVNDCSEENLAALLKTVDYDIESLAKLAFNDGSSLKASSLLLGAAVVLAEGKAIEAETKADEAHIKATDADGVASEAQSLAIEAEGHAIHAMLGYEGIKEQISGTNQGISDLQHRVLNLEQMLAKMEARLQALEQENLMLRETLKEATTRQ